jgi:hypothetical protein
MHLSTPVGLRSLQQVGLHTALPGRLGISWAAYVRARVAAIAQRRRFNKGRLVPVGLPLFEIDARTYHARLGGALTDRQPWVLVQSVWLQNQISHCKALNVWLEPAP